MNEKTGWTIAVVVCVFLAFLNETRKRQLLAQETPAAVASPEKGALTILGGISGGAGGRTSADPGSITLHDAGGSVAGCSSCARPLSFVQPSLPHGSYLAQAHVFPCFACGQIHLVGELRSWAGEPGTSLVTDPPTWAKWTWRDRRWEPWR